MRETKFFYATDIHGSEICFKKFINAAKFYKVNPIILGGDMTGKMVVSFLDTGKGWKVDYLGKEYMLTTNEELKTFEDNVRNMGYYPYRTTPAGLTKLTENPAERERMFMQLMREGFQRWISYAEDRFKGTDIRFIISPGNDDPPEIYGGLSSPHAILTDGSISQLDADHEFLSYGVANRTPWNTHREADEETIENELDRLVGQLKDVSTSVFSIHCPPYNTKIDMAPFLTQDLQIKPEKGNVPVGSSAVKKIIEKHQPLLALHGHIHESPGAIVIGRTLCLNPGSEYTDGILRGVIVVISDTVKQYQFTIG